MHPTKYAMVLTCAAVLVLGAAVAGAQQILTVSADRVNLRAEANTSSKVLTTLGKGSMVEALEKIGDWYRVKTVASGVVGFIHAEFLQPASSLRPKPEQPAPTTPPAAKPPAREPPAAPAARPPAAAPARPASRPAAAPQPAAPTVHARGYVSIRGGYQGTSNGFDDTLRTTVHAEEGRIQAAYPVKAGILIDVAGGVRVWRDLTAGIAVSAYSRTDPAAVTASLPHPFYFDKPRSIAGDSAGLQRTETAVHIQAGWWKQVTPTIAVGVLGGPSYFQVEQPLVSAVDFSETYPYDTAEFVAADTQTKTASKLGFNVGADVLYSLTGRFAVSGLVRFSKVSLDFDSPDQDTVTVNAGGLQAGAGLTIKF